MAEYTIELRSVVDHGHNIFDFAYPFYDESKRHEFEEKFIRHFYFREIGAPTIDRFKFYLQEKMLTVFPYYNELFNAAAIEYSVLNNYNLTEEFSVTRENEGRSSGESYTVGQLFANQETNNEQIGNSQAETSSGTTEKDTESETGTSETDETTHSETDSNGASEGTTENTATTNGNTSRSTSEHITEDKQNVRKFLDTPQGLTDLSDTKYITDLTRVNEDNERTSEGSETVTNGQTTSENGSSETSTTDHAETDSTRNTVTNTSKSGERNSQVNQNVTGNETSTQTAHGTVVDEQKSTQDNNIRTATHGKQIEKHTLTRIGNIGVDTDSDMIEKHIRLQKTLKSIELLFFNECEDLFMLVY